MADTHFLIEKKTEAEKTVTSVCALNQDSMVMELARLIGGAAITGATLKAAGEMKSQAEGLKEKILSAAP
jgi:DNA repair protein RecN (Recombination protein N)